jgi:hypothetical protein
MVDGPKPGDASYDLLEIEKADILNKRTKTAARIVERVNQIHGFHVDEVEAGLTVLPMVK